MVKNTAKYCNMYLCAKKVCEKVHLTFMVVAEEQKVVPKYPIYLIQQ